MKVDRKPTYILDKKLYLLEKELITFIKGADPDGGYRGLSPCQIFRVKDIIFFHRSLPANRHYKEHFASIVALMGLQKW